MTLSPERRSTADAALEDLERQRLGAWFDVTSTLAADDSSRAAALHVLGTDVPNAIDSLRRQLDRIDSDARWRQWVADANELQKTIAQVGGSTREWGLRDLLLDTAGATLEDVGQTVSDVREGAKVGSGLFTFAALAFIAWKVIK